MRNYNLYIVIICISLCGCNSLRSNKGEPINKVRFNAHYFLKHRIKDVAVDTLKDGTIVTLGETKANYYATERNSNNPYSLRYTFYKDSYSIKGGGTFFYDNPVGTFKEYDKMGNVINQKNYDELFKFPIQNLIDKMSAEYKINLMIPIDHLFVNRYKDEKKNIPFYAIRIPFPTNIQLYRYLLINGNTGKTAIDTIGHYDE